MVKNVIIGVAVIVAGIFMLAVALVTAADMALAWPADMALAWRVGPVAVVALVALSVAGFAMAACGLGLGLALMRMGLEVIRLR